MKPQFYFSYVGGKTKEMKNIEKYIILNKIDTIVEPFCGSCVFSRHVLHIKPDMKIIINDLDHNLIEFYLDVKKNGSAKYFDFCRENWKDGAMTKEEYNKLKENNDLFSWFFLKKIYSLRSGLYPISKKKKTFNLKADDYKEFDDFFQNPNVYISCQDYKSIMDEYAPNRRALIFLDPPYFLSYNSSYTNNGFGFSNTINKDEYVDPTFEFVNIKKYMIKKKSKIIMIINQCSLLEEYYRDFFKESYDKRYEMTKKLSRHMILTNY